MVEDGYLDVHEVADLLHTTVGALYQHRRRRTGPPAAMVGSRLLYRRGDIDRWVAELVAADPRARAVEPPPADPADRRRSRPAARRSAA